MTHTEQNRATERDALLTALKHQVESDPRIDACWLFGSFGRGTQDSWSDLDVVIVIADDHFDAFLAERTNQISELGNVVLKVESAQNGPPGGCYLMAGYESSTGIQLVDWYWQPSRSAKFAKSEAVLVMRRTLPCYENTDEGLVTQWQKPGNDRQLQLWNPTEAEDRANCAALACAMLAIQAKAVARHPEELGLTFQAFLETLIARASNREDAPHRFRDAAELTSWEARLEQIALIAAELKSSVPKNSSPADAVAEFFGTVRSHIVELTS